MPFRNRHEHGSRAPQQAPADAIPLLPVYYLAATPVFLLLDAGLDVNVRASFLGDAGARLAYYAFCIACGVAAWRLPSRSPWIGLGESAVTITLLIVGFMSPILNLPAVLAANPDAAVVAPVTTASLVNFAIAAGVAWWSFQRASGHIAARPGPRTLRG